MTSFGAQIPPIPTFSPNLQDLSPPPLLPPFLNFLIRLYCRTVADNHLFLFHCERRRYVHLRVNFKILLRYCTLLKEGLFPLTKFYYPLYLSFLFVVIETGVSFTVTVVDRDFGDMFGTLEYRYQLSFMEMLDDVMLREIRMGSGKNSVHAYGRPPEILFPIIVATNIAIYAIRRFTYSIYRYFCWNHGTVFSDTTERKNEGVLVLAIQILLSGL